MNKVVFNVIVCGGIFVLTCGLIFVLKTSAPKAKKKEEVVVIPSVKVFQVGEQGVKIRLTSEGLVSAKRETVLTAEVPGRIVFVDPRFEVGGEFKKDEIIVRLDEVNFTAAVAQAQASVADAELTLKQERARGEQARRDWEKIGRGRPASEMVLRIPYLKSAQARLASAEAALEKARQDLKRTRVRAPFDCRVRETSLDLGAMVAAGAHIGEVYDHRSYEVRLPFALLDYPLIPRNALISLRDGNHDWMAQVTRREGDLDRATLSAYLVADVQPNHENPPAFWMPLPGMFLKGIVEEVVLSDVVAVPRAALRGREKIAIMNDQNELEFRTLEIVRASADFVYVSSGVQAGERVILTRLEVPVAGMKLAVSETEQSDYSEPK